MEIDIFVLKSVEPLSTTWYTYINAHLKHLGVINCMKNCVHIQKNTQIAMC